MATSYINIQSTGFDFSPYITSITHKMNEKKDNELTLSMIVEMSLVDKINKGDIYTFRYGWFGGISTKTRKAKIVRISIKPVSKERCSVNITATDLGFSMKYQKSDQIFKDKTSTQIVTAIANKYDFANVKIDNTTKVYPEIIQSHKSDFEICQMLAKREHLKFYVDDDEFFFTKEDFDISSRRTYVYGLDKEFLSWSITSKSDKASAGVKKQVVQNVNPDTGELVKEEITDENQDNKVKLNKETPKYSLGIAETGAKVLQSFLDVGEVKETKNTVTGADKAEVKNQANALKEKNDKNPIEVSANLRGNPSLVVGDVITLKFPFLQYSGNYKIVSITNKLDVGSTIFQSSLSLTTNATRKGDTPVQSGDVNKTEGQETDKQAPKKITGRAFDGSRVD